MMTNSQQFDLADKAADFSLSTMDYIGHLLSILQAIEEISSNGGSISTITQLSNLGSYLGRDYYNIVDLKREEFQAIIDQLRSKS